MEKANIIEARNGKDNYKYITPYTLVKVARSIASETSVQPGEGVPNSKAPAFKVYKSTGSETYSTGDVVIFNAKSYDIDDNYDISTGKFTAPKKGIYHFSCGLGVLSPNPGNRYGLYFRVNGVNQEFATYYSAGSTGAVYAMLSTSLLLDVGDEFDVTVNFDNAKSLGTGKHVTRLSGYLIREVD